MTKIHYDTLPTRLESLQAPPLDPDVERDLILRVQWPSSAEDRETAFEQLWAAHSRAAHQAVRRGSYDPKASLSQKREDQRDTLGEVALAFYSAVVSYDMSQTDVTLAAVARPAMWDAVQEAAMITNGMGVNRDQLKRYIRVLRAFDGDYRLAYLATKVGGWSIAPHEMEAIRGSIVTEPADIDDPSIADEIPQSTEEDRWSVNHAFTALSDREQDIIRLAYGFTDPATEELRRIGGFTPGERMYDWQIAETLGVPRRTVSRVRKLASRKMRDALLTDDNN